MGIKGKHSKKNENMSLFFRSFILTLCAASLIVIGYYATKYMLGNIQ